MGVSAGDTILLCKDETTSVMVKIGGVTENYVNTYIYMTQAQYEKLFGETPDFTMLLSQIKNPDISDFAEDEEFLERFDREAHTASKMSHHNIVNLLDMGQEGELRYIVMEYVNGRNVSEIIKEEGVFDWSPIDSIIEIDGRMFNSF